MISWGFLLVRREQNIQFSWGFHIKDGHKKPPVTWEFYCGEAGGADRPVPNDTVAHWKPLKSHYKELKRQRGSYCSERWDMFESQCRGCIIFFR